MSNERLKTWVWNFFIISAIIVASVVIFNFIKPEPPSNLPTYNSFLERLHNGDVRRVEFAENNKLSIHTKDGETLTIYNPGDDKLVSDLINLHVDFQQLPAEKPSLALTIFVSWFPILLLVGVWIWFMNRQGAGGAMGFKKNPAKLLNEETIKTTFNDVAGVDEAKHDVQEFVEFLRNPTRFTKLGGKIPKGALLVGPPGTGKTLLARAIAGEAGVPFFSVSGSHFVEMFVGVGASRVRDMFEEAKKKAPCIIFIDEIDALGRARGNGPQMGQNESENTLNQLLTEMDGFEQGTNIIIFAATNRPDVLDPALKRPGRFDREIHVNLPDITGREQILKVHTQSIIMADDIDLGAIARGTPGFSGAELANLVNEAAILAGRCDRDEVHMRHFEKAKDKILMGAERKTLAMTEEEKRKTAFHEAGHAIVGMNMPEHDPVYKVSIMPRGRALGITMFLPERDQVSASKQKLKGQLASLFGGRIAEEIIYGKDGVTTGASNDIERATAIATKMVTEWGLSGLRPIKYLGEQYSGEHQQVHSDELGRLIQREIDSLIDEAEATAMKLLERNKDKLHLMTEALMEHETIDLDQIKKIMA